MKEEVSRVVKLDLHVEKEEQQERITQTVCKIAKILNGLSGKEIQLTLKALKKIIGSYLVFKSVD